jgi:hypothetical protein
MDQSTTRAYRPLALGAGDTTRPGWPLPVQAVPRFTSEPLSGTNHALAGTGRGRSVPPSVGTSLSHLTPPQLTSTFFLRFRQDDRYRSHPPWSPLRRRRNRAGCSRRGAAPWAPLPTTAAQPPSSSEIGSTLRPAHLLFTPKSSSTSRWGSPTSWRALGATLTSSSSRLH